MRCAAFLFSMVVSMAVPSTFSTIRFVRHHRDTLVFLSPETRDVAVRDSGDK